MKRFNLKKIICFFKRTHINYYKKGVLAYGTDKEILFIKCKCGKPFYLKKIFTSYSICLNDKKIIYSKYKLEKKVK